MNKKWYKRIMIVFSLFMIALLLLQLLAGLLRPTSRSNPPPPTAVSSAVSSNPQAMVVSIALDRSRAEAGDRPPASRNPLAVLGSQGQVSPIPWRPAQIGPD